MRISRHLSASAPDGIDVLGDQHRRILIHLEAIDEAAPEARLDCFKQLSEMLTSHESSEELLLRPVTRRTVPGGTVVAEARAAEEIELRAQLTELALTDFESRDFISGFHAFSRRLVEHMESEETYEFPLVRAHRDGDALVAMGTVIRRTEPMLPPVLPGAPAALAGALVTPITSVVGKMRGALVAGVTQ